jgi:hypothetical protein
MWMVGFAYWRLYPEGESPWYFLDRRICELQNQSGRCGIENKFCPVRIRTPAVQPVFRHYADWATDLFYVHYGLCFLSIDVLLSSHFFSFSFFIVQNLVVKIAVLFNYCTIFNSYFYCNYYAYRYVYCFVVLKICDNSLASLSEEFLVINTGLSSRHCILPRFRLLFVLVMASYICIIWRVSVRHIRKTKAQSAYETSYNLYVNKLVSYILSRQLSISKESFYHCHCRWSYSFSCMHPLIGQFLTKMQNVHRPENVTVSRK